MQSDQKYEAEIKKMETSRLIELVKSEVYTADELKKILIEKELIWATIFYNR